MVNKNKSSSDPAKPIRLENAKSVIYIYNHPFLHSWADLDYVRMLLKGWKMIDDHLSHAKEMSDMLTTLIQ